MNSFIYFFLILFSSLSFARDKMPMTLQQARLMLNSQLAAFSYERTSAEQILTRVHSLEDAETEKEAWFQEVPSLYDGTLNQVMFLDVKKTARLNPDAILLLGNSNAKIRELAREQFYEYFVTYQRLAKEDAPYLDTILQHELWFVEMTSLRKLSPEQLEGVNVIQLQKNCLDLLTEMLIGVKNLALRRLLWDAAANLVLKIRLDGHSDRTILQADLMTLSELLIKEREAEFSEEVSEEVFNYLGVALQKFDTRSKRFVCGKTLLN